MMIAIFAFISSPVKIKKIFYSLLIATFVFNTSCIHTESVENKSIDLDKNQTAFTVMAKENLQIEDLIYVEEKYPLGDFFHDLQSGKFNEAFHHADLKYHPSNSKNQILRELIHDGYIPAYVRIKNVGKTSMNISERNFFLTDKDLRITAISSANVPREFNRFNSEALAANIYNVTVVTTAVVGVVALLVATRANLGSMGNGTSSGSSNSLFDSPVINDTQKTTHIDYRDYLIRLGDLMPGESTEGLLFFLNSGHEARHFRLEFGAAEVAKEEHL